MIENNNFLEFLKWRVDRDYSCETNSCVEEGICRCSTIGEVIIESIDIKRLSYDILSRFDNDTLSKSRNKILSKIIWDYDYEQVNTYCIERILTINKIWNISSWVPVTCNGYYGQELEEIIIQENFFERIIPQIQSVLNMETLEEKVYYLLELEYGNVSDNLLDKKMSIKLVDYNKIIFTQETYLEKVKEKKLDFYKKFKGIKGLVRKFGDGFRVVDGYHRLSANTDKKVSVIVVE